MEEEEEEGYRWAGVGERRGCSRCNGGGREGESAFDKGEILIASWPDKRMLFPRFMERKNVQRYIHVSLKVIEKCFVTNEEKLKIKNNKKCTFYG